MKSRRGFTLIEILITITLISILALLILPNINAGSTQARDAERKATVSKVQAALELYKEENGRYPEGCNDGTPRDRTNTTVADWSGYWSGQAGSGYECASGNQYIIGLAPEFISVLPVDQNLPGNSANEGYVYTTNPDGTVYKFMAMGTVETETVTDGSGATEPHPFARCGNRSNNNIAECGSVPTGNFNAATPHTYNAGFGLPSSCTLANIDDDYAVFGGYARGGLDTSSNFIATERAREQYSDAIRCK